MVKKAKQKFCLKNVNVFLERKKCLKPILAGRSPWALLGKGLVYIS